VTEADIKKDIARIKKIVHDYIDGVLLGEVVACRFVKLACTRHLNDLKDGSVRGLIFREDKAYHAVKFFSFLKLWKGRDYKGLPFTLAPHNMFAVWVLMGWYRTSDNTRRFRKAYIEMARKGAKSTLAGGLAAYFFIADGEDAGEIYTAAVKREQAKIVWDNVRNLTEHTGFAKNVTYLTNKLSVESTNSKCEPLSSDAKSLDGLDTHFASLDELHAHPDSQVHDLISDSIGARSQPLILIITTAGFNQTGICYQTREYLTQILRETIQDDSFFGMIFTLDVKKDWPDLKEAREELKDGECYEDDWTNEDCWVKAAPGLIGTTERGIKFGIDKSGNSIPGYMTKIEDMRDKARIARQMPSAQNNFLTKRLNIWTQSENRWIDLAQWDLNNIRPVTEETCRGRACVGGIDLSAVSDLTVWGMLFRDEQDKDLIDILFRVWCPEARLFDTKNKYRDQYKAWADRGFLTVTPGDAIDYDMVRGKIAGYTNKDGIYVPGDKDMFNIQSISVDRGFQGYEFSQKLDVELGGTEKDPKVMACGMGWVSMNGPCQEFERLLLLKKLNHGGNPIARFAADNVSVKINPTGGGKSPNKASSQGKIDPIVVILLGLDRLLRVPAPTTSIYAGKSYEEIKAMREF
jgi:phage terminase large subunit-like protein